MKAPTYRWVCHKCGASNEPHTTSCASCNFAAVASARDAEGSPTDYKPAHHNANSAELASQFALFFPEGLLAAALVLVAPIWSIRLAFSGHLGAAGTLIAGVSLAVYAFVVSIRHGHRYLAYFAMIGAIALAFVVYSETQ